MVANNFHFENNCAILSLDGYPYGRTDIVMQMLRANPQLKVFTIHDASYAGAEMPLKLRDPRWFPDPSVKIIDLGLRPAHAQKANLILVKHDIAGQAPPGRSSLTADELAWLAQGNMAELSALRPARLMRSIFQGFARANQMPAGIVDDDYDSGMMIWVYDPGMDIYAADSFG